MPRIIMNRGFIARWTRMPHSTGRLSASASSHHSLSSAAFITNIAESDFRHAQAYFVRAWCKCASPKTTRWSTHSRRIDPISLSAKPFCQGEPGAMGLSLADAHGAQSVRNSSAIDAIPIADQVARRLSPRECFGDLACDPVRGRMGCDVDPDEVSAGQPNDDKGIEQAEANGRNNEQVHGGDVRRVVTQEGAPALGRRSTSLDHVLRDARLSDLKAELE